MIDIGANLAHETFAHDLDHVLTQAWDAGVQAIVVTGSCMASSRRALLLAQAHPGRLYATAGLHPHHAAEWSPTCAANLGELGAHEQVVSLGECGLDYFRDLAPRRAQRTAFVAQLELAVALRKPVFLHQRDAHTDFVAVLREFRSALSAVCVHCFTDTAEAAQDYLALDCHIGITGWICDERRGTHLLEVVRDIPAARLLVETDAPYLLPRNLPRALRPVDGRRNEPRFLPWVVAKIADARGESADLVASQTARNARAFFALA
ncbi:TatD family hydrolase [Panacagrimonas sp.]|uniref:TatD family hydrolase n=1 Tax=Panacagrimonas sp. TaxID=2480088 RepID=UPI003B52E587